MKFKNFLIYLAFLLPWFLTNLLFKTDVVYYRNLNLPWFAPPPIIFAIIWPILYLLISYSVYKTFSKSTTNYKIYLVINYLANQLFSFSFFILKNNFLALVDVIIVLISSMYLYVETKLIDGDNKRFLIPYIIWNVFALLLIFTIFIMN